MRTPDWLVVSMLCLISLVVGLLFSRRSSKGGAAGYFTGGRDLPWWAIGLSNTATYQSGNGGFVMLVLVFGLAGNWLWWSSWIIWMPLVAIVWARMWRRMQIVTTAELLSLRYGGRPAQLAGKVYVVVCCFGFSVLLIGYVTGFFAKTIAPLCSLSTGEILLIFGGITAVYTMFGGLVGVDRALVLAFRDWAGRQWGLKPRQVMISATHTHSGPATIHIQEAGEYDEKYVVWLDTRMQQAAEASLEIEYRELTESGYLRAKSELANRGIEGRA
jgi:hypothetical protein